MVRLNLQKKIFFFKYSWFCFILSPNVFFLLFFFSFLNLSFCLVFLLTTTILVPDCKAKSAVAAWFDCRVCLLTDGRTNRGIHPKKKKSSITERICDMTVFHWYTNAGTEMATGPWRKQMTEKVQIASTIRLNSGRATRGPPSCRFSFPSSNTLDSDDRDHDRPALQKPDKHPDHLNRDVLEEYHRNPSGMSSHPLTARARWPPGPLDQTTHRLPALVHFHFYLSHCLEVFCSQTPLPPYLSSNCVCGSLPSTLVPHFAPYPILLVFSFKECRRSDVFLLSWSVLDWF